MNHAASESAILYGKAARIRASKVPGKIPKATTVIARRSSEICCRKSPLSTAGRSLELGAFIHEDHLEHEQVVIERDQAAEERESDEPKQAVIPAGSHGRAEEIKLPEESRERRQAG